MWLGNVSFRQYIRQCLRQCSYFLLGSGLLLCSLWIADLVYPLAMPNQHKDFATVVLDDEGYPLRAFADKAGVWRYEVSVEHVSPDYIEALIAYEDRYFYQHPGVNPLSFLRAAWQYVYHQRIISGGSTLTMQVARLLHPHERTLLGKTQQTLRALQLEWHLSKQQILSLYLNYAPFGGTIEGVQAASYQYLRKPASDLRPAEAALLAVLPQSPSFYRPDRHPKRATRARNKVIDRLVTQGVWSQQKADKVKQEPIVVWTPEQPLVAPLLARRLRHENPTKPVIKTFIKRSLQQQISSYVQDYAVLQGEGVSMAVLVVDNQTQHVISYIGSAAFQDESRAGHVDMIQAIRSPGSTLKPLLYGLAIDEDLIHSHSLLADVPRVNSRYRPGNFAKGFDGPVTASDALQRSLNIPFVQLIEAYGEQKFTNKLAHVLHPLRIPEHKANASIILGGAGSSMQSLVALHSSFVNKGWVKPLVFEQQQTKHTIDSNLSSVGRQLMSEEAAWITWKTLTGVTPPKQFNWGISNATRPELAWKTGTSWASRDTWAIGSTLQYTVGVWVGKPSGEPLRGALGVTTAAPALFSVVDMLQANDKHQRDQQPKQPVSVQDKEICWPDGRSVSLVEPAYCERIFVAYTKEGVTPRTLQIESGLAFHQAVQTILVDVETKQRLSAECATENSTTQKISLWPRQLEPWLHVKEKRSSRMPLYSENCLVIPLQAQILIIEGILDKQIIYRQQLMPIQQTVHVAGAGGAVSWYLNGQWLATKKGNYQLTLPKHFYGENELVAVDEQGVSGRIIFEIKDDLLSVN